MRKSQGILLFMLFPVLNLSAQNKEATGTAKISPSDFKVSSPVVDTNANAVVISHIGSTEFQGNNSGDFTLVFKVKKRILIRNRKAFDVATVEIPVYTGSNFQSQEKLENLEAVTYNLENDQVVATWLEKDAVFTEKVTKERIEKKFTFPNIREGSIIEYSYTIKSPFYTRLRSWYFQGEYPCLWSEYRVTIPPMFNYMTTHKGYLTYTLDSVSTIFKSYAILEDNAYGRAQTYRVSGNAVFALWGLKDIPAFKVEKYTTSPYNYVSGVEFLLHSIKYSDEVVSQRIKDWISTANSLRKDPDFGLALNESLGWLDDTRKIIANEADDLEKAKKIYEYVRDNFTCDDHDEVYLSQTLKKTYQSKKGNVTDLNMLLAAMLLHNGYDVTPVILSTRSNGIPNETAALLHQYNYTISRVLIWGKYYLLDASHNRLGFGKLPTECYNGTGRLIAELPVLVDLSPDSVREDKVTSLFIINTEKGLRGTLTSQLGQYESYAMREKMIKTKKEDLEKELAKSFSTDIKLSNLELDLLKVCDMPLGVKYDLAFNTEDDIIYFNPMLGEATKNNPFTSAERLYPVEMPYTIRETYVLDMDVPKGYKLDEVPKSVRFKLNENEGMFEYLVSSSPEKIRMRCVTTLNKATFLKEDYESLREFYAFIIKKQSEQIVFKKIQ